MLKPNRNRPVRIKFKDNKGEEQTSDGLFQVWGYKTKTDRKSGALMMESRAVVELPSGQCVWVNPAFVIFLDVKNERHNCKNK